MSVRMTWKSGMKYKGIGRFSTPIVTDESKRARGNEGGVPTGRARFVHLTPTLAELS